MRNSSAFGRIPMFGTALAAVSVAASSAPAQFCTTIPPSPLPLQPGQAVVTQHEAANDPTEFVLSTMDLRDPACYATLGQNWCVPRSWDWPAVPITWNRATLGDIFAVTLDDASPPNIYVASAALHGDPSLVNPPPWGVAGAPSIYRLNGATGAIDAWVSPTVAGNPAFGDICYDTIAARIIVSDFNTGLILSYPSTLTGTPFTFDHGAVVGIPDTPATTFTPLGRRVWAVKMHHDRLYYSVQWDHDGNQDPQGAWTNGDPMHRNQIWSVRMAGSVFDPTDVRLELEVGDYPGKQWSNPVSSIDFAADGRMILAERGWLGDYLSYWDGGGPNPAHAARTLEFVPAVLGWQPSAREFWIGNATGTDAAGGVAYSDCTATPFDACLSTVPPQPQHVWATGDHLLGAWPVLVYGVQGISSLGNSHADAQGGLNSYYADLNNFANGYFDKTDPHDIAIHRACEPTPCELSLVGVQCLPGPDGSIVGNYLAIIRAQNASNGLLATSLHVQLWSSPTQVIPISLGPGEVQDFGVTISGTGVLLIWLHDSWGHLICMTKTGISELPDCPCMLEYESPLIEYFASPQGGIVNSLAASFAFTNMSSWNVKWITIVPWLSTSPPVSPGMIVVPGTGIPPGQTVAFNFSGLLPVNYGPPYAIPYTTCYLVTFHATDFVTCCSSKLCIDILETGGPIVKGDLDGSGGVGATDLGLLLGAWGTGEFFADLDKDGTVDAADLGLLLAAWEE